ncbi:MAG TPA: Gfo/Idh/MocA family oxidoreductase [Ktedonobacteraceae bacterium]|jgi:predicted dehydrogenase|nr:Gfo/Idh/MocA family oxidoreductase [Ktedonobacteraceae bacterium]
MPTQRIYLIGAGRIARTHADAISTLPDPALVSLSVADPNPHMLADFSAHYPHAHTFDNAQTMLAEAAQDSDIVIVATPPFTHYELTCAALSTGRHVLCEKPLAMDRVQARQMLVMAKEHNRLLGCCSVRFLHWSPAEEARRLLTEQALGDLYHVRFSRREQRSRPGIEYQPGTFWFLDLAKSGGGTLMDRAPYEFTMLNNLFQPERVDVLAAWLANPTTALNLPPEAVFDVEQHGGATLRYHLAGGKTFIMTYERSSCSHSDEQSLIEIEGLEGTVRWSWPTSRASMTLTHSYDRDGMVESKTMSFPPPGPDTLKFGEKPLAYFYRRMVGQPSSAVVNEQALFNFSCISAIYDCAQSGQPQTIVWGE